MEEIKARELCKKLVKKKNLTREEIAKRTGLPVRTVDAYRAHATMGTYSKSYKGKKRGRKVGSNSVDVKEATYSPLGDAKDLATYLLHTKEYSNEEISSLTGLPIRSVGALKAHLTRGTYSNNNQNPFTKTELDTILKLLVALHQDKDNFRNKIGNKIKYKSPEGDEEFVCSYNTFLNLVKKAKELLNEIV